jgi:4-diphosphocytidyl-2-C-methyl-D-erythritol kinase
MLTVQAPAKLNLTLEVLGKRPDGFHEIHSVMQAINLCDSLHFESSRKLAFKSNMKNWNAQKSLVSRAASLLQDTAGCEEGATIEVDKRIPLVSGLGGDSSDAAATLHGLNELWGLGLPPEKLIELAPQLGSDVAFFIYGGTALTEGRGEKVTPQPPLPHMWIVLTVPKIAVPPGKTAKLYASLKASHYTDGHITSRLIEALKANVEIDPSFLFNTFENVAFTEFPELKVYKDHIIKLGATRVHLAGSGPTLFTLIKDRAAAEDLHTRCQQQGMETYLAETL